MFCPYCMNETQFEIKKEQECIQVRGEEIIVDTDVTYCKCCREKIWNEELDNKNLLKAYEIYRQRHKLLSAAQIKRIREKYKVSQQAFSRIIGVGDKTITRYENGAIQDSAINSLIELMDNVNNFKMLFERRRSFLDESEIAKIESVLDSYKAKVLTLPYDRQKALTDDEQYFGGFTYEQKQRQYQFKNAI